MRANGHDSNENHWPRLLIDLMAMTQMRTNWSQLKRELMDKSQMRDNDHDYRELMTRTQMRANGRLCK